MYQQYGDSRFPADFGAGHSHAGIDAAGGAGRYMYGAYYGPKGPDGSPFGNMNPSGSGMQSLGGKPPSAALQDSAYTSRWGTPGYMRAVGLKPTSDYMYTNQVGVLLKRSVFCFVPSQPSVVDVETIVPQL